MSYSIYLLDPVTKEVLLLDTPHQMKGANYCVCGRGMREASLSVTYNYSYWYYKNDVFPGDKGIRSIYDKTGAESIPILKHAIETLKNMDEDISDKEREEYIKSEATGYWMPTRENAIRPLCQLLAFAQLRPDGVWEGD